MIYFITTRTLTGQQGPCINDSRRWQ